MIIPVIDEVQVIGVADRGVPNKERVLLRPLVSTNLQNFVLAVGYPDSDFERIIPIRDFVYFFDNVVVEASSWVAVYTGPGQTEVSRMPTTLEKAYSYHWGHKSLLFAKPEIIPVLFRVAAMGFAQSDLPGWQTLALPAAPSALTT